MRVWIKAGTRGHELMQVLLVEKEDFPAIEVICQRAFEQMDYANVRGYTYDSGHIFHVMTVGLSSWRHIMVKCVMDGVIVGFMAAEVGDFSYISVDFRRAHELVWHPDTNLQSVTQLRIMKALVLDMIDRTECMGASLQVATDNRFPSLERMLIKMGFAETSKIFTRRPAK